MALNKKIELTNGVEVNYHRIVSLNKITNVCNNIEVASYTSKAKREEEQEALVKQKETRIAEPTNIYIDTTYFQTDYDENMTIENAYEYLKTTEKLKNAEDC